MEYYYFSPNPVPTKLQVITEFHVGYYNFPMQSCFHLDPPDSLFTKQKSECYFKNISGYIRPLLQRLYTFPSYSEEKLSLLQWCRRPLMIWLFVNSRYHFLANSPILIPSSHAALLREPQKDILFISKVQNALSQVFVWFTPLLFLFKHCTSVKPSTKRYKTATKITLPLYPYLPDPTLFFPIALITM